MALDKLDLDDPQTTVVRREVIRRKSFLNKLYFEFYREINSCRRGSPAGPVVELGSGPGFIKKVMPQALTSEVFLIPDVDLVLSGQVLPFKANSLSCIVMLDVFHHLAVPLEFLKEAERCLKIGGKVIMIEPFNTPLGSFIYRILHHERFDPEGDWNNMGGGPLSGANGALPWIMFVRDIGRFRSAVPGLVLKSIRLHTPFAYLISGGLSFRSFVPGFMFRPFRLFESLLNPVMDYLAMFSTIELQKIDYT